MIGRKLVLLKQEEVKNQEEVLLVELPYLKEVEQLTVVSLKKHGYALLVAIVRFYVRGTNLLKNKYEKIKIKIKKNRVNGEKKEISRFLKIMGDYKHKIREIKHKIKKEENL
ncbi:MAG TPA: hypothetical protein VK675_02595 [Candidatus Paceibacterota bacterium]|nr:hypothetical protein [Candidatus Paceibacterota bacterium]